jgi:hypothetical protein
MTDEEVKEVLRAKKAEQDAKPKPELPMGDSNGNAPPPNGAPPARQPPGNRQPVTQAGPTRR